MSRFKTAWLVAALVGVLALSQALVAQTKVRDELKAGEKVAEKVGAGEKIDTAGKAAADKVADQKAEPAKKAIEKAGVEKLPVKDAAEKKEFVAQVKDVDKIPPRGRLPSNFGKLGISEQQRERIYSVQAEYNDRIDILLVQIEELRAARDAAIDEVLTDGQRQRLKELRVESIKEKVSGKKTATKKPGGE